MFVDRLTLPDRIIMFKPKLFETLRHYNKQQFTKDVMAGLIVGLVALPLAIAFAIASGVSPEKGLYTAIVAGFIISALGGSRVQIGGPTGAFIVIVYGIVQSHGINGLIIATFMAGILLIIMGVARLGSVIKYIPHPLIIGFTSGIALIIFSSQMKDFLGLQMGTAPADFIDKWKSYIQHFQTINIYTVLIGVTTVAIILLWPRVTHKVPGSLIAILITTALMQLLHLPIGTIGSKFGNIPSSLPKPVIPHLDFNTIRNLIRPAFTIALLGAIESLLSAVVSDGMIGGNHKSNVELVAQGVANIFSSIFGGIPATGAIARTATNVKNGGRTPVAGMIHAITLLLILLFFLKWAALIPMATLAGILVVVAYNMSEWRHFLTVLKGPRSDMAILLTTFLLTVLVDLTAAIEIGMILAVFLFMRNMIKISNVSSLIGDTEGKDNESDKAPLENFTIPKNVEVYEITGPLFFGAAYKFKDAMRLIEKPPAVLIIRMRKVPIIDATGIKIIEEVYRESKQKGTKLILSEIDSIQIMEELKKTRLLFSIGKANVTDTFQTAIDRSIVIMNDFKHHSRESPR
jgi:SulP family sulfate permease